MRRVTLACPRINWQSALPLLSFGVFRPFLWDSPIDQANSLADMQLLRAAKCGL